jgi:hypothetical protein
MSILVREGPDSFGGEQFEDCKQQLVFVFGAT